jgi:hypothetical protein
VALAGVGVGEMIRYLGFSYGWALYFNGSVTLDI